MMNLRDAFALAVDRTPNGCAIVEGDTRYSYKDWAERIYRLGNSLNRLGINKGDRVLLGMKHGEQLTTSIMALQIIGAVAVPYNPRSQVATMKYYINDSGARGIIFDEGPAQVVLQAVNELGNKQVLIGAGLKNKEAGVTDFEDLIKDGSPVEPTVDIDLEDIGIIIYTSGTTGDPKGVAISHGMTLARVWAVAGNHGLRILEGHRIIGLMPLYHTIGLHACFLMSVLLNGTYYPVSEFVPSKVLDLIEKEKITHIFASPTHFYVIINSPEFSSERMASVRDALYAGAPMATSVVMQCTEKITENFTHIYGSSETYCMGYYRNTGKKPQALLTGITQGIHIIKPGGMPDEVLGVGEEGEVICSLRSSEAFSGYWNKPEKTSQVCKHGWYYTGDAGVLDADGSWRLTGRVDDMIISGGENIHPAEVENVLIKHPDVADIAVIGVSDDRWGQVVKAFVQCKRESLKEEELDKFLLESIELDNWKRPKYYEFVDSIPRTPSGKVQRFVLRDKK
jgi:2-furoate---CoA ligase